MSFTAKLEQLEWSGRQWRADRRGAIPGNLPPVFERLGNPEAGWVELLRGLDRRFCRVAGGNDRRKGTHRSVENGVAGICTVRQPVALRAATGRLEVRQTKRE
ncbi:MAG: hypothetical protein NT069_13125 [Planctomycetota bacterium]|nr:hypothetical protein [Planctomycetota bacterium]